MAFVAAVHYFICVCTGLGNRPQFSHALSLHRLVESSGGLFCKRTVVDLVVSRSVHSVLKSVGCSAMNIDSQSFHTFVGLPIGLFNDLQISMIPKGGKLNISWDVEQKLVFFM